MKKYRIFITGGAGYVGTRLSEELAENGHNITIFDTQYFGTSNLEKIKNIEVIKGDIRDTRHLSESSKDHEIFLHLACISNDSSFALNEKLSTSINLECFEPMVIAAKKNKISKFIYASTSSVYGLSKKKNVKEDHPLVPLTLYNKYKGECEPLLFKHTNEDFVGVVFRPATVCGYSKRLRLDLTVNILTNFAYNKGFIKVFGGDQMRPNLNIKDYIRVVNFFINAPKDKINNEIFNVGYQNLKVKDIALIVKKVCEKKYNKKIDIKFETSDDHRSYHINSDKIYEKLNFKSKHSIEEAVEELCEAFEKKKIPDSFENDIYYNVKRILRLNIN
jgi:nucleoside-diphosphate-sugar epimerase